MIRGTPAVLGLIAMICVGSPAARVAAQATDPHLVWRTVRSRHFEIHYHEPLGLLARRVSAVAERAHATLAPILGHDPDEITRVVLSDNSDSANGSATAIPYNTMRLYATGPEDLSALSDYDDWFTELVTHENTHVLHLDTIGGIPAIINAIFGKVYPPNAVQPRWFLEGLAVHHESEHTSGGRIRSTFFDMFLRTDVLEDRVLRLDQISNAVDRYPQGNVWYLYGSRFVHFIDEKYGEEAIREMSQTYGSQLIPYGINRVAMRATGKTFIELYREWVAEIRRHYREQASQVRARGLEVGTRLTSHGQEARAPRFIDDRRLVYWAADGDERAQLRLLDAYSGEDLGELDRAASAAYSSPHPDGRHVYYSSFETWRDIYGFFDIFRIDREGGARERLTRGLRAQEPDCAPDGRRIAFTVNGAATTHLAIADIADIEGTRRIAFRSQRYHQVYTPKWSPDGRTIAFSAWRAGGYRDILLLDVESGRVEEVTNDRAQDSGPAWSPDGRVLYFSSDRTGISNIYAYELASGTTRQVTNVLGGAFSPTISPDGRRLAYLGFRSEGWDVWGMDLEPVRFRTAEPYVDDRPEPSDTTAVLAARSEPYEPLDTLLPRSWFLRVGSDAFGTQLAITTEGGDIVGYHRYSALVGIGLVYGNTDVDLSYVYQRSPLPIGVRLFHRLAPRSGLLVEGEPRTWIERSFGADVGVRYFFPRAFLGEAISLNYAAAWVEPQQGFSGNLDPNDPPPSLPQTGLFASMRLGWSWNDLVRTVWDISPSEGRAINLSVALAHPYLGSQFESISMTWAIAQYLENPFVPHHVLALRYAGGISGGDAGRRALFSVGGFPEVSILDQLINLSPLGGQALRGYPPYDRSGDQYHLLQAEYRFPIWRPMFSVETLPFYIMRIYGTAFMDVGDAFFDKFNLDTFRVGVGGELFADFMLGYFLVYSLRVGIARGLMEGGATQGYVHLGVPF